MNFSNNLKRLRKSKGLSQAELANYFGIGRTAVTNWENGSTIPGIDVLDKLASIFDVSADDLIGRDAPIDRYKRTDENIRLLSFYTMLNDLGKREAVKRVAELTQIPQYAGRDMPIAAHNDAKLTDEELRLMREDIDEL